KAPAQEAAALRAECLDLAVAILGQWPQVQYGHMAPAASSSSVLWNALVTLGDPGLIGRFLGGLMIRDVSVHPGKSIAKVCEAQGWDTFRAALQSVMEATNTETVERNVELLEEICSAGPRKKAGSEGLCVTLATQLVNAVIALDQSRSTPDWRTSDKDRTALLTGLIRSLLLIGRHDLLAEFLASARALPKKYPLRTAQIPALEKLRPWLTKTLKKPCPPL